MGGVCGDDRHGSFTTLDNVFTEGESAESEERAGQLHPHLGGLYEGVGEGGEKFHRKTSPKRSGGDRTQQKVYCDCQQICGKKVEIQNSLIIIIFYKQCLGCM